MCWIRGIFVQRCHTNTKTHIMMVKKLLPLLLLLAAVKGYAQHTNNAHPQYLSFGVRNTFSVFNGGNFDYVGMGVGGHFRIPIIDRINTEWYGDYINNNIGGMGHRTDFHIGWSVMFYLIDPWVIKGTDGNAVWRKFTPFVEAGHCFDYGGIYRNGDSKPAAERWSSAVQAGAGTHYNISPRFDITLKAQYMMHLGNDIHGHVRNGVLEVEEHEHGGLEGHLLFTLSVNYKLIKLWEKVK